MNVFQNINTKTAVLAGLLCFAVQYLEACTHNQLHYFDCDLCGCSTSSGSTGFGTLDNLSFVGLRYIYQNFESRDGIFSNSPTSKEQFNTYQLWGRVPINDSFYVNGIVPYQDLTRKFNDKTEHLNGLGDVSLIGWYQLKLYKKKDADAVDFSKERVLSVHRLNFGLGVKLPTGEFEEQLTDRINPGFQVGTGSWDVIVSMLHIYSKKAFGLNTTATYYLKTENKNAYQFGNQLSLSSNAFYMVDLKKSALIPFIGASMDVYDSIQQYGETLPNTDGSILNGSVGSELKHDRFILGGNYTFPISQQLFGDNVTAKSRVTVYLNYVL